MLRRRLIQLVLSVSALSGLGGAARASVQDIDVAQQIGNTWLSAKMSLFFKDYAGARSTAERLYDLRQYSSTWNTHAESFLLGCMLVELTPPREEAAYVKACLTVLACFTAAFDYGDLPSNLRNLARAGYGAFGQDRSGRLIPADERPWVAMSALAWAGVAFGPERRTWAAAALVATRQFGSQNAQFGDATDRMMAAAIAAAGDWNEAIRRYDPILKTSSGALLPKRSSRTSNLQGLSNVVGGVTTVESEAATVHLLAGRTASGLDLLERSRRESLNAGEGAPGPGGASAQVAALTRRGAIVVQITCSWVGTVATADWVRKGKPDRCVVFDSQNNSFELMYALLTASAYFLTGRDGLIPRYSKIRRSSGKRADEGFQAHADRAANLAGVFIGNVIQTVLSRSRATDQDDIVLVLQPSLGLLPAGLALIAPNVRLVERHRVRVVDSLYAATRAANLAEPKTASVALISNSAARGLRNLEFEAAAVCGVFPSSRRVDASNDPRAALLAQDGASHWHIPSHGVWDYDHPERSGLLLGKRAVLTVNDVLALSIAHPPRLVFLSACEAGLPSVREPLNRYVSLAAAFLKIGVKGVVAPLWAVSDVATALLSARFYELHITGRLSPAAALRQAELWLSRSTASTFRTYLDQKVAAKALGVEEVAAVASFLGDLAGSETPFAHPYYAGGFQLFGA